MSAKTFKIKEILKEIFISLFRPFKGVFSFLALVAITIASSLLVVTPLWYFATSHRQAYTFFSLILMGLSLVLFITLRIKKIMLEAKQDRSQPYNSTLKLTQILFSLVSLALFILLFFQKNFLFALSVLALYFIGRGVIKYVGKRTKERYSH